MSLEFVIAINCLNFLGIFRLCRRRWVLFIESNAIHQLNSSTNRIFKRTSKVNYNPIFKIKHNNRFVHLVNHLTNEQTFIQYKNDGKKTNTIHSRGEHWTESKMLIYSTKQSVKRTLKSDPDLPQSNTLGREEFFAVGPLHRNTHTNNSNNNNQPKKIKKRYDEIQ